ncbi:hypothetical protein NDU88_002877 [Pleurodeles waltl]|uniref:EF-hand domain-containing protein n=1 Tax=Pleurodeles waltl TaxID=8319 RepID=A0AAV7UAX5_PLEWA|nr:hypothetical protein NDU88_002877 [Pleurodeles waltl]
MATDSKSRKPVPSVKYDQSGCENAGSRRRSGRRVGEPEDARWKQNFFDKVQQRGLNLQQATVDVLSQVKAEEEKLRQKSPPDPLASEWFSADKQTVDTRVYLLDKLLPTLVPGVEKLLKEVEKRHLLDPPGTTSPTFNPVNFLAETLMRNNPQFVGGQKTTAYARGLKQAVKDLKSKVFELEFNRLAQLKQEMKETLEKREKLEDIEAQVKETRKEALALQFPEWTLDVSGRIPAAVIQSALKSFQEVASHFSVEPKFVSYSKDLATEETLEHKLNADEFIEYVHSYTKDLSTDLFLELLHHLSQSADVFRETIRHDRWRQMFTDLFLACDHGKVGVLDRQRVLLLLEAFYNSEESEVAAWGFRNPRQWPMIEFREMDPTDFWADFDEAPKVILSEGSLTAEASSVGLEVRASGVTSGALGQAGSQTDRGVDSVTVRHSVERLGSVQEKKSRSDGAVDAIGERHSAGQVGSVQEKKSRSDRAVDSVAEQHSAGLLGSVEGKKSKSADLGAGVSAVSSEGKMMVPDPAMPILEENTNTNAGNDDLQADPAQGNPQSPTREPSTNVENVAPGRGHSATRQSPSLVLDTQPVGDEQTVIQTAMSSTSEDRVKDGEGSAEEPTAAEEPSATTVTEEKRQSEPSVDVTGETKDSEDQKTGDEGVTKEPQDIDGIPWSGDLLTTDLALKYGSYGNRSLDEWSVAASRFTDLRSIITDIHSWEPPRVTSAFDRSSLNLPQFVQLMETFLGEETSLPVVEKLVAFIQNGYMETEEEKFQRLEKARREAFSARRKLVLEALFQKWDNDGCGFIELSTLEAALSKYKEGMESALLTKGRERLKSAQVCRDDAVKINSRGFQRFLESLMEELPGTEEEVFQSLVEFLTASIERTQTERMRGSARRKWLHEIQRAAERSGGSLEPIYQATFQALYKDSESHGNKKKISASIGLLEQSPPTAERGPHLLRYVACTLEDAPYVLNKALYRDMKGVSFNAVDDGKPVHVPRVQYHGNIHFWKYDRPLDERTGSFLVLPLKDSRMRIFGTLGIDTIRDPRERNIFLTHEISFYQGVSNTFSEAYHYVQTRRNILLLVSSALAWIHNRAPDIQSVTTYLMEPGTDKVPDYVLRKVMTTDNNTGVSEIHPSPGTLRRKENIFRDYLFKCADSSEVITTDAYGERHIAVPIREPSGRALAVMDVSTGQCRDLPAHEFQDLQKMLQMLQAACSEILEEAEGETEQTFVLEAERTGEESRMGVLFHRFMLQDLRECVQKLDHQSFAELKSYKEPPTLIHNILRAVLLLFHPELAASEEVESWNQCKLKVNTNLVRRITSFDPTASTVHVKPELVAKYIKGIPRGAVWRHGSIPAEYLYNWAFTCLSLLELNPSLPEAQEPSSASLVQESSAAALAQEPSAQPLRHSTTAVTEE